MTETALSAADTPALIAYARQKSAEERYPLSLPCAPADTGGLAKLDPESEPVPLPPAKSYAPSLAAQRRKKLQ